MSLCNRVATLFRAYPGEWLDGRELAKVGGYAGWRTRVSDLRKPPYGMTIENRTRRSNGFTVSEYRFLPDAKETAA